MIVGHYAKSQNIDYTKIILPEGTGQLSFEEKLVQLAWKNHPSNLRVIENVKHAQYRINQEKVQWTDNFYAVGNLNEFTINPSTDLLNRSAFYPRYNFGIRLSLGDFVITPIRVKAARSETIMREHQVNEKKLDVRKDVLTRLETLKQYYKILKFRKDLLEGVLSVYQDIEKQFQQGKINIDAYQSASQAYSLRSENVIFAQSTFNQSKLAIEELIGLKLEDVSGYDQFLASIDLTDN